MELFLLQYNFSQVYGLLNGYEKKCYFFKMRKAQGENHRIILFLRADFKFYFFFLSLCEFFFLGLLVILLKKGSHK